MSRPPASEAAPQAGAGGPWLPGIHGLRVDLGHRDARGRWLRPPTADFTCHRGCARTAAGAEAVAAFCARIDQHHARHCPGLAIRKDTT